MVKNLHKKIIGPAVAVDTIVFSIAEDELVTLLIQIGSGPYKDKWALPGGLVQLGENTENAAIRVLRNKTNVVQGHLEQLYTFGDVNRDIRGQIISIAYLLLVDNTKQFAIKTTDFYFTIKWAPVKDLPLMAFDHEEMIRLAYNRLKSKAVYSNIVCSLLPKKFTLSALQHIYEIIWNRKVDKRNFRKKIIVSGLLTPCKQEKKGAFRPARLYKFKQNEIIYF